VLKRARLVDIFGITLQYYLDPAKTRISITWSRVFAASILLTTFKQGDLQGIKNTFPVKKCDC
jgi:hypothetical protein